MSSSKGRREFLKRLGQYSAMGSAAQLALPFSAIANAASSTATDYKAIVCVYLYGGNDYANTVVPYDTSSYNLYKSLRPTVALDRSALVNTVLQPKTALSNNLQFALEPNLAPLANLFANNQMDVMLNIGTLVQPTTKAQYKSASVKLPPRLFSHNDQQKYSQSFLDPDVTGWGGRIEDLLMSGNANTSFSAISVAGNASFLSGSSTHQFQVGTNGSTAVNALSGSPFGSTAVASALKSIISNPHGQILGDQIVSTINRSILSHDKLAPFLTGVSPFSSGLFPANNSLASQLQVVARIIRANQSLGMKRQVFFVSLGGFDNHDHLVTAHPVLMKQVGDAIGAFQSAITSIGMIQNVCTFTSSDFGRTLTSNGDGADHGWGSHHFVLGGPITQSKFIGTPPTLANDGPDDVGQGRLIPTTSWDQLAYSLGSWFGASASNLNMILPNANNFSRITL
jgi:uncharacterized protein (DUF1501 family)